MTKKDALIITIVGGLIVSAITIFVFTPIGNKFLNKDTKSEKSNLPENVTLSNDEKEVIQDSISSKKNDNDNIFYLQSYNPVELFDDSLILTLNNNIKYLNQNIELKLVKKSDGLTTISKNKKIGDILIFDDYTITFLSLERNISTYDLRLKIEKNAP